MAEHAVVVNVSRYQPAPGRREELLTAMHRVAERAIRQEGCFGAQTCLSDREPDELVGISRWKSRDALAAFREMAEFEAEQERLTALLAGPAEHENLMPV